MHYKWTTEATAELKEIQKILIMIGSLTEIMVKQAICNDYIKEEQHDEYAYALNLLFNVLITDVSTVIIGLAMHMIWECVIFWIIYKIMRKYCGGFHFSTSFKCYLSSCVMCPIVLLTVKYVPFEVVTWSSIVLLAISLLFILSPVAAKNKPLDEKEIVLFSKVARISILVIMSAYIIAVIADCNIMAKVISLAIIFVAFFAVLGEMQLKYHD